MLAFSLIFSNKVYIRIYIIHSLFLLTVSGENKKSVIPNHLHSSPLQIQYLHTHLRLANSPAAYWRKLN